MDGAEAAGLALGGVFAVELLQGLFDFLGQAAALIGIGEIGGFDEEAVGW